MSLVLEPAAGCEDSPPAVITTMGCRKQTYLKGRFEYRRTEGDYMAVLLEAVTLEEWRSIVTATVAAAKAGDHGARAWLAQYLVGKPGTTAPAPLTVVVQQLSGRDPLVDALAKPEIERMTSPFHSEDAAEDAVHARVAQELRALEAQKSNIPETCANTDGISGSTESSAP